MTTVTYRTKPVTVEAIQYTPENAEEIFKMFSPNWVSPRQREEGQILGTVIITDTDGLEVNLRLLDWVVIRDDEFNIVSPETFEALYEKMDS